MVGVAFGTVVWVGVGLLMMVVIWRVGMALVRSLTTSMPAPPPPGEMRKVSVKYRCSTCGLEIKTTLAPDEDPPPPRHCLEDMDLVAPIE